MSKLSVIALLSFLALAVVFMNGCEVDSASETIYITPDVVTVKKGQSVQFTASGGYEYTWKLEGSSSNSATVLGILSSTRGSTVTYTSLYTPTSSNVTEKETLTVSSMISGDSRGTNTTSSMQDSATATIYHSGL